MTMLFLNTFDLKEAYLMNEIVIDTAACMRQVGGWSMLTFFRQTPLYVELQLGNVYNTFTSHRAVWGENHQKAAHIVIIKYS